jgi:hypothetical protein
LNSRSLKLNLGGGAIRGAVALEKNYIEGSYFFKKKLSKID